METIRNVCVWWAIYGNGTMTLVVGSFSAVGVVVLFVLGWRVPKVPPKVSGRGEVDP